jgi:hypothetical protein
MEELLADVTLILKFQIQLPVPYSSASPIKKEIQLSDPLDGDVPLPMASTIDYVVVCPPICCARKETHANLNAEVRVFVFEKLEQHNHL